MILANDPRLPSAPEPFVRRALTIAEEWIKVWYGRKIHFEIAGAVNVDSYFAATFEKLPIVPAWKEYPYRLDGTDTTARFVQMQTSVLQSKSIPALQAYVPEPIRPLITSPAEAAKNILALYDRQLAVWKSIRAPSGVFYFDTAHPEKHSYWHWERLFESLKPEDITDHLIVTNVMLIDDALSDAPPHSLIRGGLLNGMAQEECPQAVVSTFPILTDEPAVSALRDTQDFTALLRLQSLGHIIAHEFGAHVVMGFQDVYDHRACLAVPTSGLQYAATIQNLFGDTPCRLTHPPLDRRSTLGDRYQALAYRYIDIKDFAAAKAVVERGLKLEPRRPLLRTLLRQLSKEKEPVSKN